MIIIIDGYNVLKYLYGKKLITEKQRVDFVRLLSEYASRKNHTIYLIFDGGDATSYSKNGVRVLYVGHATTADDVITSLLSDKIPEETLVVSSDNAVTKAAHRHNIVTIDGSLFCALVQQQNVSVLRDGNTTGITKMHEHESSPELDLLMLEIGDPPIKTDEERDKKVSSKSKKSRHEKKLTRVVKKL